MINLISFILISCLTVYILSRNLPTGRIRKTIGWLLPVLGYVALFYVTDALSPFERMIGATAGMLYLIKGTILLQRPLEKSLNGSKLGLFLYLTLWPGMNPTPFDARDPNLIETGERFTSGYTFFWVGLMSVILCGFCPRSKQCRFDELDWPVWHYSNHSLWLCTNTHGCLATAQMARQSAL